MYSNNQKIFVWMQQKGNLHHYALYMLACQQATTHPLKWWLASFNSTLHIVCFVPHCSSRKLRPLLASATDQAHQWAVSIVECLLLWSKRETTLLAFYQSTSRSKPTIVQVVFLVQCGWIGHGHRLVCEIAGSLQKGWRPVEPNKTFIGGWHANSSSPDSGHSAMTKSWKLLLEKISTHNFNFYIDLSEQYH